MQEVQAICNRVIIISKGKIVADDPIERLQQKSSEDTVVMVEFRQSVSKEKLNEIPGLKKARLAGNNKWQLTDPKVCRN
jgi:ABC-2 type transport system ATP-binding protein